MGQVLSNPNKSTVEIKAEVYLQRHNVFDLDDPVARVADDLADAAGKNVELQLVSVDVDPDTGLGKRSKKTSLDGWLTTHPSLLLADQGHVYTATFKVKSDFGEPGAILIENHHPSLFYLSHILLTHPLYETILEFPCNSWVYNHHLNDGATRIFFSNKVYLPNQTPDGLRDLRYNELEQLRGDGKGRRWRHHRIYDYDVYNDLADPDKDKDLYSRPILGGSEEYPYPRRCRTGRERTKTDPNSERPVELPELVYVPRDERFRRIKKSDFLGSSIKSFAHAALPEIERYIEGKNFESFKEIKDLYSQGLGFKVEDIPPLTDEQRASGLRHPLELIREILDPNTKDPHIIRFPKPQIVEENETAWEEDDEFARQMLAGLNPMVIERVKEFPIKSKLDPTIYGPIESKITTHDLERNLDGLSVKEAIKQNRLYILDFHDAYLPYLDKINALEGKAYASRTVLFLTAKGTLRILAIELSLPPTTVMDKSKAKRVFLPHEHQTTWNLAKAHVSINDAGYHQLVSHWMRTHATIEPFIIATYRQLSAMHPLHMLLKPHFTNTMNINAIARKILINAYTGQFLIGGVIERTFFPGRYSMMLSSIVYKSWRFDEQGLPADLIKRGVAEEDKSAKHGLKLLIEDYPYAVDGLDIWFAIKEWVSDYIKIFYKNDKEVRNDLELQRWWKELRDVGHGDKKEGWIDPQSGRPELVEVITTIIWLASAHHAAVNFGQYAYGGFMPNKPTTGRKLIPDEEDESHGEDRKLLSTNPASFFLNMVSTKTQALIVISILEILSTHSVDEEYLGQRSAVAPEFIGQRHAPAWIANNAVLNAFERFKDRLIRVQEEIEERNRNPNLLNRHGAAKIPYTLLVPYSSEGLTGRGIPNSTSI